MFLRRKLKTMTRTWFEKVSKRRRL